MILHHFMFHLHLLQRGIFSFWNVSVEVFSLSQMKHHHHQIAPQPFQEFLMKVFFSFSSSQVLLEWLKELPLSWNLFLILTLNQHQISLWKPFLPSHLIQQYLLLS